MIKYKKSKTAKNIKKIVNMSLQNKLYVNGWCFYSWMQEYINDIDTIKEIAIAYDEKTPIGVALRLNDKSVNIGVYVKPQYRRKGIGTRLVKKLKPIKTDRVSCGTEGSRIFWTKLELL